MIDDEPETVRNILHSHISLSSEGLERLTARVMAAAEREASPTPPIAGGEVERIAHAIDHFEPPFIGELANERETWIADNMRHELLTMVRGLPLLAPGQGGVPVRQLDRTFRCLRTGNPVGTDTQMVGLPCDCDVCFLVRASAAMSDAGWQSIETVPPERWGAYFDTWVVHSQNGGRREADCRINSHDEIFDRGGNNLNWSYQDQETGKRITSVVTHWMPRGRDQNPGEIMPEIPVREVDVLAALVAEEREKP